jgi:hypothetical protein
MEEESGSGWFVRYVSTLKGNCKWCHGDKSVYYLPKSIHGGENGKTVPCPRCKATGDEPHCDDRIRMLGITATSRSSCLQEA